MDSTDNRRQDGAEHETLALAYLEAKGYRLVEQNFRYGRRGEIDLIMLDGETWVFIEVKARRNYSNGRPEDSITPAKQRTIRRVAEWFVHLWRLRDVHGRFDVVAVDYVTGRNGQPEIRHLLNAFP